MQLTDDFCKAISDITSVFHCNPAVMCDIHKLLISWTLMFSCSPLATNFAQMDIEVPYEITFYKDFSPLEEQRALASVFFI